jgi:hypothetical protein
MTLTESKGIVRGTGTFVFSDQKARPMTVAGRLTYRELVAILSVDAADTPGSEPLNIELRASVQGKSASVWLIGFATVPGHETNFEMTRP